MNRKAELIRRQARIVQLEAALRAAGLEPPAEFPPWSRGLTRQEIELMTVLLGVYPRLLDHDQLDDRLTHQDHAAFRNTGKLAQVLVNKVRGKLGPDAIETVWGRGYRAGPKFVAQLAAEAAKA